MDGLQVLLGRLKKNFEEMEERRAEKQVESPSVQSVKSSEQKTGNK